MATFIQWWPNLVPIFKTKISLEVYVFEMSNQRYEEQNEELQKKKNKVTMSKARQFKDQPMNYWLMSWSNSQWLINGDSINQLTNYTAGFSIIY